MKDFTLLNDRGVQFTLPNRLTISIMFNSYHYCSSTQLDMGLESDDAEIAILYYKKFVTAGVYKAMEGVQLGDDVCITLRKGIQNGYTYACIGHCTMQDVLKVINFLSGLNFGDTLYEQIINSQGAFGQNEV